MALIKCPECGREVSDSAVQCPQCGFGVAQYITRQRSIEKLHIEAEKEAFDYVMKQMAAQKEEEERLNQEYNSAVTLFTNASTAREAILAREKFAALQGWKESDSYLKLCREKADLYLTQENEKSERIQKRSLLIVAVITAIIALSWAIFSYNYKILQPSKKYKQAQELFESGDIDNALIKFQELDGFKDSEIKVKECIYLQAQQHFTKKNFDDALYLFKELGEFKDSEEKIEECYYGLFGEKSYKNAKDIESGDIVRFGRWWQGERNIDNTKTDIEWIVLDKTQTTKLLLISRYVLDAVKYDESKNSSNWETSTLRAWLNGTFYNEAFSDTEKRSTLLTRISGDNMSLTNDLLNACEDRVFVLSVPEAEQYFKHNSQRVGHPTKYAQGGSKHIQDEPCSWWLRTPSSWTEFPDMVACIASDGRIATAGDFVYYEDCAVRPCIWIDAGGLD